MTCEKITSSDTIFVGENQNRCLTTEIDVMAADIKDLKNVSTAEPMLIAAMHAGRLDNATGGEFVASNRICSDAFAVEKGTSYWQVNDLGLSMYVLVYDADEIFVGYLGKFASGQKIDVNLDGAVYMRLSSMVGENDLTNEFRIFDTDPTGIPDSGSGLTKEQADTYYAAIDHTHTPASIGAATVNHTHTELHTHGNKAVLDGITAAKVTAWDNGTSGEPGADGKSAYEVAVKNGFVGTEAEWLASLQGTSGADGMDGSNGATFKPAVDGAGNLSWTNDKGLPNPSPTNIKGPAGDVAQVSASDILSKLLTVDGENSGLDADYLDGRSSADFASAAHNHNLNNLEGALPINKGGTGSTSAASALSALGASPATHSHTPASIGAAAANHGHNAYAAAGHNHDGAYAAANHGHTPAGIGAAAAGHRHDNLWGPDFIYIDDSNGGIKVNVVGRFLFNANNNYPYMSMSSQRSMTFSGYGITGKDFHFVGDVRIEGDIYGNPSINRSSDAREKHDIRDLDTKYEDLFNLLRVVTYEYNNGRSQRDHVGFIAQEVEQALETAGLTTQEFAGFVKTPVFGEKEVRSIKEVVDEKTGEVTQQEVVTTEVDTDVILDEKYSLRYDEFIGLCVRMIQKLMKRVDALEARLEMTADRD